ncbi:MAG: (2Fe-2S)-binding protein [Pseudomonadota bacterium]
MARTRDVTLQVNGETVTRTVPVRLNLVDFLRNDLGLTGSHVGCEHGVCGACTVEVDGRTVRACLMLAVQAHGADVVTVEGLNASGRIGDLKAAFHEHNALQCGYCTPGMLASALEYIEGGGTSDRRAIREHLSGNYCRCSGYQAIVDAMVAVIEERATP